MTEYNPFEFFPEPQQHDQAWWDNLATVVKELAELLATRPQQPKRLKPFFVNGRTDAIGSPFYEAPKATPTPKPAPVAVVTEGNVTTGDMPRATMIQNERVYAVPDICRFLGVSRNFIHDRALKGMIETFSPEFYSGSRFRRKFVREDELKRFLGSR